MGRSVGGLPQALDLRRLGQRPHRDRAGELAQAAGDRPGERLHLRRQLRLDLGLDVDVGVQLVDQEVGERVLDRLVGEQLGAGVDPGVGLEQLALRPDREDRDTAMTEATTTRMSGTARRLFAAAFPVRSSAPTLSAAGPRVLILMVEMNDPPQAARDQPRRARGRRPRGGARVLRLDLRVRAPRPGPGDGLPRHGRPVPRALRGPLAAAPTTAATSASSSTTRRRRGRRSRRPAPRSRPAAGSTSATRGATCPGGRLPRDPVHEDGRGARGDGGRDREERGGARRAAREGPRQLAAS